MHSRSSLVLVLPVFQQLGLSLPFSRANETEADTIRLNYQR